ncbi:MAG: hypothetical protein GC192_17770 [Bacteroidetes bacterium]|nr:hypothetical protein [Bacteroidota bacterium]
MKKRMKNLTYLLLVVLIGIGAHVFYLTTLSATETYPSDTYLQNEANKTALIIVAHDDDMVGSCGTMTKLCQEDWKIREMCFYQEGGKYSEEIRDRNSIRKTDLQRVAIIQGFAGVDPIDFNFRNDMQTEKPYMPMPYSDFPVNYKLDSLAKYIGDYIEQYKPSVLFTLDSQVGGYGHPDHVVVSQSVLNYCRAHKNDDGFSVKRIYQAVFAPSLAERVIGKMPAYVAAKKVYECDGMPLPDVQFDISPYAEQKKKAMLAYTTEQNSLKKIWPYYNWYPAWLYFRIFDRDFFKIVDVEKL